MHFILVKFPHLVVVRVVAVEQHLEHGATVLHLDVAVRGSAPPGDDVVPDMIRAPSRQHAAPRKSCAALRVARIPRLIL